MDPLAQRKRKYLLTRGAVVAVLLLAFGKTAFETILRPARQAPPGYAQTPPPGNWAELSWNDLYNGKWDQGQKPILPPEITSRAGKLVRLKGFVLPLHQADEASEFFLAKSPGGCFFCSPPGINQVAMVLIKGGKKLARTDLPVYVYGKFRTATGSKSDMALYVVEDAAISLAQ